jgi:mono/diheme cytochrome c family protein
MWLVASPCLAESPRVNFLVHCSGCHLPDGRGQEGSVPDLSRYAGRFAAIPAGRAFLVQVPGSSQSPLDDAETAALLNWILANIAKADVAPYTVEEVTRYRGTKLLDVQKRRAEVLAAIGEGEPGY